MNKFIRNIVVAVAALTATAAFAADYFVATPLARLVATSGGDTGSEGSGGSGGSGGESVPETGEVYLDYISGLAAAPNNRDEVYVLVQNIGSGDLHLLGFEVSGNGPGPYSSMFVISEHDCPAVLPEGGDCSILFQFNAPDEENEFMAALNVKTWQGDNFATFFASSAFN